MQKLVALAEDSMRSLWLFRVQHEVQTGERSMMVSDDTQPVGIWSRSCPDAADTQPQHTVAIALKIASLIFSITF
jgi:hypothetical protein